MNLCYTFDSGEIMKINNEEINIENVINDIDIDGIILKRRENNFLLSDYQIGVLNRYGINYLNYSNIRDLLFDIEEALSELYDDEVDNVGKQIAEYIYYNDTRK